YARGDENNLHQPDAVYYLGPGQTAGYVVVNVGAAYQLARRLRVLGEINNVFDRRYDTGAQLGPTGFTETGTYIARPFNAIGAEFPVQQATFFAPGAPRTAWLGARITF